MALRLSTGLRNAMLSSDIVPHVATITAATIAAVDGGAGNDSLTDSGNGFITAGFTAGDEIVVKGFTGGGQAVAGPLKVLTVTAGVIEVPTGSLVADLAGESVTITALSGGSLKGIFKDGVMRIYDGIQPATADLVETGSLVATITKDSGVFTAGAVANGLEFQDAAGGVMSKLSTETWSGLGLGTYTAGWFRFYTNALGTGASGTAIRFDGSVGTSGQQLNLNATAIILNLPISILTFTVTMPAA